MSDATIAATTSRQMGSATLSPMMGTYWSSEDPRKMTEWDWRDRYAVAPEWNSAEYFVHGLVQPMNIVEMKWVEPLRHGGRIYPGGGTEVVIGNPNAVIVVEYGPMTFRVRR